MRSRGRHRQGPKVRSRATRPDLLEAIDVLLAALGGADVDPEALRGAMGVVLAAVTHDSRVPPHKPGCPGYIDPCLINPTPGSWNYQFLAPPPMPPLPP